MSIRNPITGICSFLFQVTVHLLCVSLRADCVHRVPPLSPDKPPLLDPVQIPALDAVQTETLGSTRKFFEGLLTLQDESRTFLPGVGIR